MAKAVLICRRSPNPEHSTHDDFLTLSKRLIPDNINPRAPITIENHGLAIAVFNPSASIKIKDSSVCLGKLIDAPSDWYQPGAPIPDGSYAIFRSDQDTVEVITDFLASRTIWFAHSDHIFVASTSQRAIVSFLKNYVPNRQSFSWMLSSGNLGPGLSWDKRLQCLQGNSCLKLNRKKWTVEIERPDLVFRPKSAKPQDHQQRLYKSIQNAIEGFTLEEDKWLLPLSGGYDSRTLLCLLQDKKNTRCVTWGMKSSLGNPQSDASIAKRLADHFGTHHEFRHTDAAFDNFDNFLDRYLIAGEGRVDHISGYMDGFSMWKDFFDSNYDGIIRGDQGFGWLDIRDERIIRHSLECIYLNEYQGLDLKQLDLPPQQLPESLIRQKNESLLDWRDRFFLEFRVPYVKAALSDLKLAYVEVISPFLTRDIMNRVLEMPDNLRTNKALFKNIALALSPEIEFAQAPSISIVEDILNDSKIKCYFIDELDTHNARQLLSPKLIDLIVGNLSLNQTAERPNAWAAKINFISSAILRRCCPYSQKRMMDYKRLALRVCIIQKMQKMLHEDAAIFK